MGAQGAQVGAAVGAEVGVEVGAEVGAGVRLVVHGMTEVEAAAAGGGTDRGLPDLAAAATRATSPRRPRPLLLLLLLLLETLPPLADWEEAPLHASKVSKRARRSGLDRNKEEREEEEEERGHSALADAIASTEASLRTTEASAR